jgi:hypothetical protein
MTLPFTNTAQTTTARRHSCRALIGLVWIF